LKILMCCHLPLRPDLGGSKVYLEAAEAYRRHGHEVDLVGIDTIVDAVGWGERRFNLMDDSLRVQHFPKLLKRYILEKQDSYDIIEYEYLYLPFERADFSGDVVLVARSVLLLQHLQGLELPRFGGLRALAGIFFREPARRRDLQGRLNQSFECLSQADLVNVPNRRDRALLENLGLDSGKIVVQPYGLSEKRWEELRAFGERRRGHEGGLHPKLVFVGTFDNRKGGVEMPRIFSELLGDHPSLKFLLLGTAGQFPDAQGVLSRFPRDLWPKIEVRPKFDNRELGDLVADCSVGIFPSHLESFGFGPLELMAAGIPTACYDVPGPPEYTPPELLAPRGDAAALRKILSRLLSDPDFHRSCLESMRASTAPFVWEQTVEPTLETYDHFKHAAPRRIRSAK
jgi:glycosyltransferase involved in cell wall biosynthesis